LFTPTKNVMILFFLP